MSELVVDSFLVLPPSGPDLREHFAYLRERGDVLKCCGIVDNLRIFEHSNRTLRAICVKCYRKHRLMFAETGNLSGSGGR